MGAVRRNTNHGFTIVELIVIVVVIGILAAITIVSYNVITRNAHGQAVAADLQTVASQLQKVKSNNGSYPASASFTTAVTLTNTSGSTEYQYNYDNLSGSYCLTATGRESSYYVTNTDSRPIEGTCQTSSHPVVVTNRMKDPSITVMPTANVTMSGASGTPELRNDGTAHSGSTYLRMNITSSGAQTINYALSSASIDSTMLPNTPYTLSAKLRPSKNMVFNAQFNFTTSGGATVTSPLTVINAPSGAWTTLHITGQSNDHVTVRMALTTASGSTWVNGDDLDIDSLMLTEGSTVYEYRDGASAGWTWNGTPNGSSSTGSTVPQSI